MQIISQILFKIALSLATEKVIKALIANALEQIVKSTKNEIDNELAGPIIDALRDK